MLKVDYHLGLHRREWLSLAGGLTVMAAVYVLLIHPSLQALWTIPELRDGRQVTQQELSDIRMKLQQARRQMANDRMTLEKLGGSPPPASQKDLQIARITALADRCAVPINQYTPVETVDFSDHRATIVEFSGQGSFPRIQGLLSRIESEIEFVDVTFFSIKAVKSEEVSECLFVFTCRINGIRPESKVRPIVAEDDRMVPGFVEVARHGT